MDGGDVKVWDYTGDDSPDDPIIDSTTADSTQTWTLGALAQEKSDKKAESSSHTLHVESGDLP